MDDSGMELFETNTHPFIVKLWLEETAEEAGRATWRGHITHVPSGRRCYLQDLDSIAAFISPYLEEMGVRVQKSTYVRRCLGRIAACLGRKLWTGGRGAD